MLLQCPAIRLSFFNKLIYLKKMKKGEVVTCNAGATSMKKKIKIAE